MGDLSRGPGPGSGPAATHQHFGQQRSGKRAGAGEEGSKEVESGDSGPLDNHLYSFSSPFMADFNERVPLTGGQPEGDRKNLLDEPVLETIKSDLFRSASREGASPPPLGTLPHPYRDLARERPLLPPLPRISRYK